MVMAPMVSIFQLKEQINGSQYISSVDGSHL
jgi:hypothetical protein